MAITRQSCKRFSLFLWLWVCWADGDGEQRRIDEGKKIENRRSLMNESVVNILFGNERYTMKMMIWLLLLFDIVIATTAISSQSVFLFPIRRQCDVHILTKMTAVRKNETNTHQSWVC